MTFKPQVIYSSTHEEEEEEEEKKESARRSKSEIKTRFMKRKKRRERKKPERIFLSVYWKRELKTPTTNILNKHKTRRVEQNEELSMVANVLSMDKQHYNSTCTYI